MEKTVTLSNIESAFLRARMQSSRLTTIHLVNGVKLVGKVTALGERGLILEREDEPQLVWYHAISTIGAKA